MVSFRKVSEEVIHEGTVVTMARGVFEGPGGERFERDLVHHPGAVVVVPLVDDHTALLVRQYRVAAEAELAEEVGRAAGRMDLMARFYNSPGFCDELTWLYLARDLSVVDIDPQGIEEQSMTVEEVRLADVDDLIARGVLVDAKTIIGLTMAIRHLA
jgi:8-oxo-dGTP pyrophosphatase MutT (NUDIX family)